MNTVKEIADLDFGELGRIKEVDREAKRLKSLEEQDEEPEMKIRPQEELMSVELFPGREGFTTRVGTQMAPEVLTAMVDCLRKNADLFAFQSSDMTGIDPEVAMHSLNVDPTVKPVKQKLRPVGEEKDRAIREEVRKLLNAGHIIEIQFPEWLSNAVMVTKGTGAWRMCLDFRDLNRACPKDHYPYPELTS